MKIQPTKNDETCPHCKQAMPTVINHEQAHGFIPGQMSIEEAGSLIWIHGRDKTYYHKECDGRMVAFFDDGKTIQSVCLDCDLVVVSTLGAVAHHHQSERPIDGAS